MQDEMSVTEAAKVLGVSRQRVIQLINATALNARKVGNVWLVNAGDVEQRRKDAPKPGKPSAARKRVPQKQKYMLMNADYPVLSFEYDKANNVFSASHEILDPERAPLGVVSPRGTHATAQALYGWWRHRAIPIEREGIDARLIELGLDSPDQIPFGSLGLSLSDLYWIRPYETPDLTWEQINLFSNPFTSANTGWLGSVGASDSPDNTSEGVLPKKWLCRKGRRVLIKGGGGNPQLPVNERAATLLHTRILPKGHFVPYKIETIEGVTVCSCPNFLDGREEFIPAWYLRPQGKQSEGRHGLYAYLDACEERGIENAERVVSEMIVSDFLIANTDRHWRNFGIVRNVDTLACRMAPIYDSGCCLWNTVPTEMLEQGVYDFSSRPFNANPIRQLLLTPDVSWINPAKFKDLPSEIEELYNHCPMLAPRAKAIAQGVRLNINQVATRLL